MTTDEKYYISCTEENGDLLLLWKPQRSGYTVYIDQAGLYSREESEAIESIR